MRVDGQCIACGKTLKRRHHHARLCDWSSTCPSYFAKPRAHRAVRRAIVRGELPPARACVCVDCGKPATEYDHRDYSRPLDVVPVCHRCNILRGPADRWSAPPTPSREAA